MSIRTLKNYEIKDYSLICSNKTTDAKCICCGWIHTLAVKHSGKWRLNCGKIIFFFINWQWQKVKPANCATPALKNWTSQKTKPTYRTFWGTCVEKLDSTPPQSPTPSRTLSVYTVLWHREGGRGGELNRREMVRGAIVHEAGSKIPTSLTVSPVYKL